MTADSAGLTDEIFVEVNGIAHGQLAPLPDRPAGGAGEEVWIDYVVALGADREFVSGDTDHFDVAEGSVITEPGLTEPELIALADRLGG